MGFGGVINNFCFVGYEVKKGSNWCNTWEKIEKDKGIKRLNKKIVEILGRGGKYDLAEVNYTKKTSCAGSIIHYILNYYKIERL